MKKFKKLFVKLFIILATFFVVLSPIVLVEEAGHTCNHEDCQICEVIRTAEEPWQTPRTGKTKQYQAYPLLS